MLKLSFSWNYIDTEVFGSRSVCRYLQAIMPANNKEIIIKPLRQERATCSQGKHSKQGGTSSHVLVPNMYFS